jgi:hypothetical protein
MTSLAKHTNNKIIYAFALTLFLITGCSKEQKTDKYIAKIDDAVLSKSMLDSSLSSDANSAKGRSEFVNDWIETEILYREALNDGITKEKEFVSLLERSKKELASTLLLKKKLDESGIDPNNDEVQKYFDEKKEDFRLTEDLFKINIANFWDYEKAIQFRNNLLETNWLTVENIYRMDKSIRLKRDKIIYHSELQPVVLSRAVSSLLPNEISIVLETEPGKYAVVQIVEAYVKDSLPPFEVVKDEAKNRLSILKKKEFVRNYINKLISDHNLEIERYSE